MSSSHPYTAVDDDDDTDICPVCDGQCTCRLKIDVNSQHTQPHSPTLPSLKIKFTLPPNLIAKRQQLPISEAYTTPLKKRGRPPKHTLTLHEKPLKNTANINKVRQSLKARAAAVSKKVVKRRRIAVESDQDESYSSDDTFDTGYKHYHDDPLLIKRSPTHDWIIRPRKKSVGGSDAEQMDLDTDTDDQVHNQNDQDQDQDDDEEEEEESTDELLGVEEDDEDTDRRHRYVGLATGWSEEEDESSFDADLFFANLSDSSSGSGSSSTSTRRRCHSCTPGDIDADQSSSTSESPIKAPLPFEVTENWDGHLIFTNGLVGDAESRGIVDNDFEKDAGRFMDSVDSDADDSCSSYSGADHDQLNNHPPPSIVQAPESSDTDMFSISDVDAGYEEDRGEVDEGDTTDEELVGDDSLPNERAMRLFTLPTPISMGISAINPMSIVSPVGLEKRRHRRGMSVDEDHEEREIWRRRLRSGPRAADILAGKTVFWEDESGDGYASSSSNSMVRSSKGKQKAFSPSSSHVSHPRQAHVPNTPRRGIFVPTGETRQAVIDDDRKGTDVPSPHPRFYGTTATTPGGDDCDTGYSTPYPCPAEVEVNDLACIVELDEVLEASFLDDSTDRECEAGVGSSSLTPTSGTTSGGVEDPSTNLTTATAIPSVVSPASVEASNKHLTRWDVISIGAFRQTREQQQQAWGPGSRSSTVGDYGGVTKTGASNPGSPLSALLWQNSGTMSSPLVLPLSSTSRPSKSRSSSLTSYSHVHSQPNNSSPTHKTRKERRREKKLLKKKRPNSSSSPSSSSMPRPFFSTHPNSASNNHHFHTHQHHPNLKTRGTSSSQRMGYFGGAVPPLNL